MLNKILLQEVIYRLEGNLQNMAIELHGRPMGVLAPGSTYGWPSARVKPIERVQICHFCKIVGRARAGLGQLSKKDVSVQRNRVASKHYRVQAQVLHLPSSSILWINTYLPTDPQLVSEYDDTELQSCLSEVETILTNTVYTDVI